MTSAVHVYPDKLPCDTGGAFAVVLSKQLPSDVAEFSLIFEGTQTGNRICGTALAVDSKTLIGEVGGYGISEEVKVEIVGINRGGSKVQPFTMTFLSRFQLICSFFPEDVLLQAPVAVARCLPVDIENTRADDDELADFCLRSMPVDLTFKHFFGSDIDEKMGSQGTLLHFAAERGMTKFAGHLLAASGGAWESLTTKNREGLTPAEIATRQEDVEMMRLFADFEDVAAENAVPLVEYSNLQELMGSDYLKVEPKPSSSIPSKDTKQKKTSLLAKIVNERKSLLKEGKKPKSKESGTKQKSLFSRLDLHQLKKNIGKVGAKTMNKIRKMTSKDSEDNALHGNLARSGSRDSLRMASRRLPPIPTPDERNPANYCDMDYDDDDDGDDHDDECAYEDIELPHRNGRLKDKKGLFGTGYKQQKREPQSTSHYMEHVVARAVSHISYNPGPEDPPDSLQLKRGQQVNLLETSSTGGWLKAIVDGRNGCVMRSAININEELYELDQGMTIRMDEIPEIEYAEFEPGLEVGSSDQFVAMYDWTPLQIGDLPIFQGDVVTVLAKNPDDWWTVRNAKGMEGLVPSTYLEQHGKESDMRGSKFSGGSLSSVTSSHSSGDSVPPPPHLVKPSLTVTNNRSSYVRAKRHSEPVSEDSGSSQDSGIDRSSVQQLANKLRGQLGSDSGKPTISNKPVKIPETRKDRWSSYTPNSSANKHTALPKPVLSMKPNLITSSPSLSRRDGLVLKPSSLPDKASPPALSLTSSSTNQFSSPVISGKSVCSPKIPPKPSKKPLKLANAKQFSHPAVVLRKDARKEASSVESSDEYICQWQYVASSPDDLSLQPGDVVIVTEQSNSDWWIGTCKGKKGVFPATFVTKLK